MIDRDYTLRPSCWLAAILIAGHVAAGAAVFVLGLDAGWLAVAGGVLALSLALELYTAAFRRGSNAVVALRTTASGRLSARLRAQGWCDCDVLGSSCVTPWLTVLNIRKAGERRVRSVVILPDSMDAAEFRELRAWLRWRAEAV